MTEIGNMERLGSLLSPPMSEQDQDTETASFMNHFRGGQADHSMLPAASQDSAVPHDMYKRSYTHNMHQNVPQGSNGLDNTSDIIMENDMDSRIQSRSANESVLPQTRTLYSAGASELGPSNAHGNAPSRQGLRLSISNPPSAVTSAVHVFAQGTPQSATSPFSNGSNKHAHGIVSGLGSSIPSGLGITIPNYAGPYSASAAQPGLFKGLGIVGGIGAAAAGAGYGNDSAKANDPQIDQGPQSSFTDFRSGTMNQRDEDDDTNNTGYPIFPHSPSRSPYLSPHSRPLTPNSEAHSPSAYPPSSPYPSPGLSPIPLSPAALSPGAHSPGPEGSGAEGDDISPTQCKGRIRGRQRQPKLVSPTHPSASAGPQSAGQIQQTPFMQGVPGNGNFSRRADTVGGRHSRSRGKSVSEVLPGSGSRGASPYPRPGQVDSRGSMLGRKHSASALSYSASHPHNFMIPHSHGNPPLEIYTGSAVSSREHSVAPHDPSAFIQPYSHSYPGQQQQFQQPNSDQYLNPPISPHSPHFGANVPGVGSPTIGPLHSPHSLSPHSLSPHSGPPPTPSPELGGPNVAGGYGGSVHSSPGLGLDQMGGMSGSGELQFVMDPGQNTMQLGNMGPPDNGPQYAQAMYANDVQLTGTTNEFGMTQISGSSGFPGSATMDPAWATEQQAHMNNMRMGAWPQDQNTTGYQLTAERVEAAYGTNPGTADGNAAYSQNPAASVQANMGDEMDNLLRDLFFLQQPLDASSLNPEQGDGNGALGAGGSLQWGGSADPGRDPLADTQAFQQTIYTQQPTVQYSHLIDQHTVPPSPAKEIRLPWDEQPTRQLPPGGMQGWQAQMQLPNTIQDGMQTMSYNAPPPHPNENIAALAVPPRQIPTRRRSKSDSTHFVQHHAPQQQTPGYFTGQVHNSPRTHSNTLAPGYAMNFGAKLEEDNIIQADGPGLKLRKTLPSAKGHRQTLSAVVPTFAVEDWSHRAQVQSHHPRLVGSQSYQGPPAVAHGAASLHDDYGAPQPGPSMYAIPGHQSNAQPPPFNHTRTYPPPNPVPELPPAGPSNVGRNNSNSKQKQQGQRNEVDERKLAGAFMPGSFRNDPALRFFLDIIRTYTFYREDELEPLVGTPEAEQLFAQVRTRYPHDVRFASRNDSRFPPPQPLGNETRDSQSIFMLLTENNLCLICGAEKDRTGRALGHVRSDIGHRPYHCTCEKCMQSANPRRFFSDSLLDDHLKGQQFKQECVYCGSSFRRGGMKRHLTSKHPEHAQGAQGNQDNEQSG